MGGKGELNQHEYLHFLVVVLQPAQCTEAYKPNLDGGCSHHWKLLRATTPAPAAPRLPATCYPQRARRKTTLRYLPVRLCQEFTARFLQKKQEKKKREGNKTACTDFSQNNVMYRVSWVYLWLGCERSNLLWWIANSGEVAGCHGKLFKGLICEKLCRETVRMLPERLLKR